MGRGAVGSCPYGPGCLRTAAPLAAVVGRGVIRAYLFALNPTDAQAEEFRSHCGAQRYAFNFGLALVKANLDQRAAERS